MSILDFNSIVVFHDNCSLGLLSRTLSDFKICGIKNFIVTHEVNLSHSSHRDILDGFSQYKQSILTIRPHGCTMHIYPQVYLSPGVLQNPFVARLKPRGIDLLFVRAPLFADADWLNRDLNYLIYKKHIKPVFILFDKNIRSCSKKFILELFKSPNAIFCLDLEFILSPEYEYLLHRAITYNTSIVPCITGNTFDYPAIVKRFNIFRQNMGDAAYLKLCKHINISCAKLFGCL